MLASARTALILVILALMVVVAAGFGWRMLTAPFPKKADAPICTPTDIHSGEHVFPAQVTVSVLNASRREGLAGRTIATLSADGFAEGTSGNAAKGVDVKTAEIWTDSPSNPAVKLVAAWLPGAKVVRKAAPEPGVVVVVGDEFRRVATNGPKSVTAQADATICSPTLV